MFEGADRRRAPRRTQDDELSARIGQPHPRSMAGAPAQLSGRHTQEGQRLFGLRCPDEETLSLPRLIRQGCKTTGGAIDDRRSVERRSDGGQSRSVAFSGDRQSVVEGKRGSVSVDLGGGRRYKEK